MKNESADEGDDDDEDAYADDCADDADYAHDGADDDYYYDYAENYTHAASNNYENMLGFKKYNPASRGAILVVIIINSFLLLI